MREYSYSDFLEERRDKIKHGFLTHSDIELFRGWLKIRAKEHRISTVSDEEVDAVCDLAHFGLKTPNAFGP